MNAERSTHIIATRRARAGIGILLAAFAVLLGIVFGTGAAILPQHGVIARGVCVGTTDLHGQTVVQATTLLTARLAEVTEQQIKLVAGGKTRTVRLSALGIHANVADAVRQAYAVGREGSLIQRVISAGRARWVGARISPGFTFDDTQAATILASFALEINRMPADAAARWDGQQVVITPGHTGAKLDQPASLKLIKQTLLRDIVQSPALRSSLQLPYREKVPHITAKMLAPVDTILGSFATSYATSSSNRVRNVELAAQGINHVVVLPNETFSFNKTVGPRTAKSGYREAPVIVDGLLQPGIGGGICQVSTTLYNAILLANLQIVTRNHHSLPSHYVKAGLDATVSYGSLDFRFKNNGHVPVVIEAVPQGRRLLVRVLGQGPAPKVTIQRSDIATLPGRTITKKDPTLPRDERVVEKGGNGLTVAVTRVVTTDAGEKRQLISRDRYPGEPTVIRIGTGPAKTPEAPHAVEAVPNMTTPSRD